MRCKLLKAPATADILCATKWAYLSYELSFSHVRAILNLNVSPFLQSDKWDGKFLRQKNMLAESSRTAILHSGVRTEQNSMKRRNIKKQEVLGCHRILTFCVACHYDNEDSLSITNTSWAPFI